MRVTTEHEGQGLVTISVCVNAKLLLVTFDVATTDEETELVKVVGGHVGHGLVTTVVAVAVLGTTGEQVGHGLVAVTVEPEPPVETGTKV